MKQKIITYIFLMLLISGSSRGQMNQYDYKRELSGMDGLWYRILLPDDIYEKASYQLNDLRIFGITNSNDTIEAPYLLRQKTDRSIRKEIDFKIINTSRKEDIYYFTFEIPGTEAINRISPDLKQQNFDWKLKLEGSMNQLEWYTITDDYRIMAIKNDFTDYRFTDILFPDSKYRYLRMQIKSEEKPELARAHIRYDQFVSGTYRTYPYRKVKTTNDKERKQTEIEIDLNGLLPVSYIRLNVKDSFDFYRPVTIEYVTDSVRSGHETFYRYGRLASGPVASGGENGFRFDNTILKRIRIIIRNDDNRPLNVESFEIKGNFPEMIVRFDEKAHYFLCYGNPHAKKPAYDIGYFTDKIPETLDSISPGPESYQGKKTDIPEVKPLFRNKAWLWGIMIVIILLLGWFSLKMLRKENDTG